MHPLPPPPPYTPATLKQTKPSPPYQIVSSNQAKNHQGLSPEALPYSRKLRSREQPILRKPRRTDPIVWCGAFLCLIFSLLLIFFGIATLIIFVAIKPRNPVFDTPVASLNAIYFDSPEILNGDIVFLANFSNPNQKLYVRFEYLYIELYFSENLIASQVLRPFSQNPGEAQFLSVHLISSLVHLPLNLSLELQKQGQRNRVVYNIKGTFRVRVKLEYGAQQSSQQVSNKCFVIVANTSSLNQPGGFKCCSSPTDPTCKTIVYKIIEK